jgi:hypothetical protein
METKIDFNIPGNRDNIETLKQIVFDLMMRSNEKKQWVAFNRRLSTAGITPLWFSDFGQI